MLLVMALDLEPVAVPLVRDAAGVLRVVGTRVALEQVVREFRVGATPEEIVAAYDVLRLADVYAVLGWYLTHRADVDAYVAAAEADEARVEVLADTRTDRGALRARLLSRARSGT
jgi:uncharacterized protein (DUF433 family)